MLLASVVQAGDASKQLPSIVGPELYELYTDAHFFVTRVFVNGKALEPGNAEGNGSTRRRGYSFSGPMGYKNKFVLNDSPIREIVDNSGKLLSSVQKLMKPGDNVFHLKVDSINKKVDRNYLKLYLECDLDSVVKKVGFPEEYSWVKFGDFFNKAFLPLVVIEFSKKGSVEILKYFIDSGFDVNSKDKDGYSLLHDAVFFDRMDMVKYLLASGLDVNYASTDGSSIFSMNANSSVQMVDYLLSQGMKIDREKEAKIVSSAVHYRNPVMAEYFIKQGYKFDEKILKREKYLLKLIQKQDVEMLSFLIKKGLDIETKVFIYGDKATLLHLAVMIKANKVVVFLLAAGADPDARNTADKPIFPAAINNGDLEVIKVLYDHGANLADTSGE